MRLTDRPRTLAEIRPDIAWPDQMEEVMARGLARDAAERYQSAAQFGRDFAEAASEMPAPAAVTPEGATMLIGAQSAAAAAGAKTKPVPATRIAGKDALKSPAKSASQVPAPIEKKSNMIPMAVGGVAVVIAGIFGATKFMGSGSESTPPDSSGLVRPALDGARPDTDAQRIAQGVAPGNPAANPTATPSSPPMNPTTTSGRPEKQAPASVPTAPPNPSSAPSAMTRITGWVGELEAAGGVTRTKARSILGEVDGLRSTLTGSALAESWYASLLANLTLEDQEGTCSAARELKRLSRDQSRQLVADRIIPDC